MKLLKYTSVAFFHSQLMYKQPESRYRGILFSITLLNCFHLYSCGGFNTPAICVVTKGIKPDCNHLMRTTYPDACVGVVDFPKIFHTRLHFVALDLWRLFEFLLKRFFLQSRQVFLILLLRADDILSPNAHTTPIRYLYYLNPILKFHIFPLYFCEK